MNLKFILTILIAFAVMACAKQEPQNFNELETIALDEWVSENAPDAKPLGETGMYYEVIKGEGPTSAKVNIKGKWVELNYVLRQLDGDIVYNRNEKTARELGTYSAYAHYANDRLYIATEKSLTNIPSGIYTAITEIPTNGDIWRVYIPSRLAFASGGFDMRTGYGGQKRLKANVPVILDSLSITDIISNPEQRGLDDINALATKSKIEGGWGMSKNDTVRQGLYMDVMRRLSETDTIVTNQSAHIYYKVRFLDGRLIYTNVDSVFYNNFGGIRSKDKTSPVRITRMDNEPPTANRMPSKVFYSVIKELRYGDIGRIMVPAKFAYHKTYMRPNMTDVNWDVSSSFSFDGYTYDKYTAEDTDYYFAATTFYWPSSYSSSPIDIAEIKPYTPLIYEYIVKRSEEE